MLLRGEIGIRTPGTSQFNGFQDRRNRPLCHLSNKSITVKPFSSLAFQSIWPLLFTGAKVEKRIIRSKYFGIIF